MSRFVYLAEVSLSLTRCLPRRVRHLPIQHSCSLSAQWCLTQCKTLAGFRENGMFTNPKILLSFGRMECFPMWNYCSI